MCFPQPSAVLGGASWALPITYDEFGHRVGLSGTGIVYNGCDLEGAVLPAAGDPSVFNLCNGWTSDSPTLSHRAGTAISASILRYNDVTMACDLPAALMCVSAEPRTPGELGVFAGSYTTLSPSFTPDAVGHYDVTLRATDGCTVSEATTRVTVDCNEPPVVATSGNTTSVWDGLSRFASVALAATVLDDDSTQPVWQAISHEPAVQGSVTPNVSHSRPYDVSLDPAIVGSDPTHFVAVVGRLSVDFAPARLGRWTFEVRVHDQCNSVVRYASVVAVCADAPIISGRPRPDVAVVAVPAAAGTWRADVQGFAPFNLSALAFAWRQPAGQVVDVVWTYRKDLSTGVPPAEIGGAGVEANTTSLGKNVSVDGAGVAWFQPSTAGRHALVASASDGCAVANQLVLIDAFCNGFELTVNATVAASTWHAPRGFTQITLAAAATGVAGPPQFTWSVVGNTAGALAPSLMPNATIMLWNASSPTVIAIPRMQGQWTLQVRADDGCSTVSRQVLVRAACADTPAVFNASRTSLVATYGSNANVSAGYVVLVDVEAEMLETQVQGPWSVSWSVVGSTSGATVVHSAGETPAYPFVRLVNSGLSRRPWFTSNTPGQYLLQGTATDGCWKTSTVVEVNATCLPTPTAAVNVSVGHSSGVGKPHLSLWNGTSYDVATLQAHVLPAERVVATTWLTVPPSGARLLGTPSLPFVRYLHIDAPGTYTVEFTATDGCSVGTTRATINSVCRPPPQPSGVVALSGGTRESTDAWEVVAPMSSRDPVRLTLSVAGGLRPGISAQWALLGHSRLHDVSGFEASLAGTDGVAAVVTQGTGGDVAVTLHTLGVFTLALSLFDSCPGQDAPVFQRNVTVQAQCVGELQVVSTTSASTTWQPLEGQFADAVLSTTVLSPDGGPSVTLLWQALRRPQAHSNGTGGMLPAVVHGSSAVEFIAETAGTVSARVASIGVWDITVVASDGCNVAKATTTLTSSCIAGDTAAVATDISSLIVVSPAAGSTYELVPSSSPPSGSFSPVLIDVVGAPVTLGTTCTATHVDSGTRMELANDGVCVRGARPRSIRF